MSHIHEWSKLSGQQLGRYAEYLAKMEFALHGFDVYSPEIDNKGIDLVIRVGDDLYCDIQVKSVRSSSYIFLPKDKFQPRPRLFAALVLFSEGQLPDLYLVPSTAWLQPNALFVSRDYSGLKSKPEWGIQLSKRNLSLLSPYVFHKVAATLQDLARP